MICQKNVKHKQEKLLPLLAFAASLFVLAFAFGVGPVYAPGPHPEWVDPGEGGSTPPNTVYGYVYTYTTRLAVHGITVYLYSNTGLMSTTTNIGGYFEFHSPSGIPPYTTLRLTVNGQVWMLGTYLDDVTWGQWDGLPTTDSIGSAYKMIYIEPSAVVHVPSAAIFSNTEYATVYYGTQASQGFSHSLNFKFLGVNAGYKTSESVTYTALFWSSPNHAQYVQRPYYAPTLFDGYFNYITTTGVAQAVPNTYWGGLSTNEYLDKNALPTMEYVDFPVAPGGQDWEYRETGSTTWSVGFNVPFAMVFQAFGEIINLDTAVTSSSGTTTWVRYRIENPTGNDMYFRVYTRGSTPNQDNEIGGMELHVWQI